MIFTKKTSKVLALAATCAVASSISLLAEIEISAEFESLSPFAVDGFPGVAGDGWTTEWTVNDHGGANPSVVEIQSTSPLTPGGGNYLSMTNVPGNRELTVSRQYEDFGSLEQTIRFDIRLDDMSAWEAAAATWFRMGGATDSANPNDSDLTWWVGTRNGGIYRNWAFRDGSRTEASDSFVQSTLAVTEGVTYSFEIHLIPELTQYYATVTDNLGNSWTTEEALNFRSLDQVGGNTIFFNNQKANDEAVIDENSAFSIDNISITVVPEPGTVAVLFGACGLALVLVRRRRK